MLSPFAPTVLPIREPEREPLPEAADIDVGEDENPITRVGRALKIELGDGSAVIDFNPERNDKPKSNKFDANLAYELDQSKLDEIASDLLIGIEADDKSRQDQLETLAEGIKLLGYVLKNSRSDPGNNAPVEGLSTLDHPLLSDACLQFNATARGEMLPASGPVKVRDDRTRKPPPLAGPSPFQPPAAAPMPAAVPPPMPPAPNGAAAPIIEDRDATADALETDFNHYLTVTASEYYPDTAQLLFRVGFGGSGFKKVYNCPLRRRPVSESIVTEDFIVSNAATDLGNARRKTHRIRMRPSTLRRMQLLGMYLDVALGTPTQSEQPNAVDQAKAQVSGIQSQVQEPKDADHEIYECYCELELDEFGPAKFKNKGLALPYRVTIEKDSRKVLEVRRNWKETDQECREKEVFVEYPFVKAFGFYGIGLLHILGNTTKTLTAAWREMVDAGMFANFPAFIYAKGAGRQLTNQFRAGPGQGIGLDIGLQRLQDTVMPFPYKDLGPSFTAFITHVEQLGQKLGGTAQIAVGEGRQDAPVGTTIALIEQATKPTGAVMKGLHAAQSKELQLFKERFQEDPEAFWRFNKKPAMPWQKEQFIQALEDYDLVPVSDPNNPTHLHRAAKAEWLKQTAASAPALFDLRKVFLRAARYADISDADDLLAPPMPPQQPQVDPHKAAELGLKAEGQKMDAQAKVAQSEIDLHKLQLEMQDRAAEREARLKVAQTEQDTERLRLAATLSIHADKTEAAQRALTMKIGADHQATAFNAAADHHGRMLDAALQPPEQQQAAE